MRPAFLFERGRVRELGEEDCANRARRADPELLSVLNLNESDDYGGPARTRLRA